MAHFVPYRLVGKTTLWTRNDAANYWLRAYDRCILRRPKALSKMTGAPMESGLLPTAAGLSGRILGADLGSDVEKRAVCVYTGHR